MRLRATRLGVVGAWVLVTMSSASNDAHAQAWVGDTKSLELSLDYNLGRSKKILADGDAPDFPPDGGSTTQQITVGAEYVPIPRLAASISLPLGIFKYTGDKVKYPHPGGGSYDDGDNHATLTDLRAGVRYQVLDGAFAVSPGLAVSIPVADYEVIGNTVAGRHLKALHANVGLGYVFGEATYVHLQYEFSLVEKADLAADTKKYSQNRSDLALTVGHKLMQQRLDLSVGANIRETHGGIGFDELLAGTLTSDEVLFHDVILDEDIVLLGLGASYQVSNAISVDISARAFITGANTQNASVFGLGVTWSPL